MISNEERRKVAAKMREVAESHEDDLNDDPDYSPFAAFNVFSRAFDRFPRYKDLLHLADLIDRPTCKNENSFDRSFFCSACGYEAWTYDDSSCDPKDFSFCPNCGAEVIDEAD